MFAYFLAGLAALAGASGFALGGRPIFTSRKRSVVPTGYNAFLVIGFILAACKRFSTASMVMPKLFAISSKVSPVITFISAIIPKNIKVSQVSDTLLHVCKVKKSKKDKKYPKLWKHYLTKYPKKRILNT
jgi:hypothetical protein